MVVDSVVLDVVVSVVVDSVVLDVVVSVDVDEVVLDVVVVVSVVVAEVVLDVVVVVSVVVDEVVLDVVVSVVVDSVVLRDAPVSVLIGFGKPKPVELIGIETGTDQTRRKLKLEPNRLDWNRNRHWFDSIRTETGTE